MAKKSEEKLPALIAIRQLPVIEEQFRVAGEEVARRVAEADSLVCTEASKQSVKAVRAQLNKESAEFKERLREVEAEVLAPWTRVKDAYTKYISGPYQEADARLKAKIAAIEDEQKRALREGVEAYFAEYAASRGIDFVSFDSAGIRVGVADNPTNLKKQAAAFIDRISDDLALIETQEHVEDIFVEYRRSLNASLAITTVTGRHKAIEEQKARQAEAAARRVTEAEGVSRVEAAIPAPLAPPVVAAAVDDDPVMSATFKATARRSQLRDLKKYMEAEGIRYV